MKTIESPEKTSRFARIRNSRGFSLIEMAIVLVIIGIIIAAIIKGQDLILNSNAKKAVSTASQWRNLGMAFYDRNGRFPGDQDKSGLIGSVAAEQSVNAGATAEIVGIMEQSPDNPLQLGSISLYYYFGNAVTTSSGARNAMVLCGDVACANALSVDQLEMIKAIDTAQDGVADAGMGQFRAFSVATIAPAAPSSVNNRFTAALYSMAATNMSVAGSAISWTTNFKGAVWLFDRPF